MPPIRNRSKHWCFTINNYDASDEQRLERLAVDGSVNYIVFGRETGESGTPHLQGFVSFKGRKRLNQVKAAVGDRAHLEVAMGSPQEAADYCMKDGDFFQAGEIPGGRGKRTDIDTVRDDIKSGKIKSQLDLLENCTSSFALTLGSKLLETMHDFDREPPKVFWIHGDSGTGKTREIMAWAKRVRDRYSFWPSTANLSWFNGYVGQEIAMFDDFRLGKGEWALLLRVLDRYELSVAIKGGFTKWRPKFIFITGNLHPRIATSVRGDDEHYGQLHRRLGGSADGEGDAPNIFDFGTSRGHLPPTGGASEIRRFNEMILQYIN